MQAQGAQKLLTLSRNVLKRSYHGNVIKPPTYNELPSPQGSWKTYNDAQQRKYNGHLMFGIAFTIGTLIFGQATGCFYLNYYPPAVPAKKNDY